jgi:Flp pilus assembly pilin Flp
LSGGDHNIRHYRHLACIGLSCPWADSGEREQKLLAILAINCILTGRLIVRQRDAHMGRRLHRLAQKVRAKSGASLTEYAVILFLVSITAVLVLKGIGGSTNNSISSINVGFGP